jgi:hypothetical protein
MRAEQDAGPEDDDQEQGDEPEGTPSATVAAGR